MVGAELLVDVGAEGVGEGDVGVYVGTYGFDVDVLVEGAAVVLVGVGV